MSPFERLRGAHLTNHPVLEDFVFSMLSLLVVTVAIIAIVAPATGSLVVTAMAAPKPGHKNFVQFYGTLVDESGQPISGASIVIRNELGGQMASTTTNAAGEWDVNFKDERNMPKDYTIEVTVYVDGQPVTGSTVVTAYTGMQWGLQMTFSDSSTWVFVPLPGY